MLKDSSTWVLKMMKVEPYRQVVITNAYVVDFMSKNSDNEVILKSCDNMLETYCKMLKDFIERHKESDQRSHEMDGLMDYMKRHNEDILHTHESHMKSICDTVSQVGKQTTNQIEEKMERNKVELVNASLTLSNLIATMTQTITSNLTDSWSSSIADRVSKHIGLELHSGNETLLKSVHDYIHMALSPIAIQNKDMLERLRLLPTELKQPGDLVQRIEEMKSIWQTQQTMCSKQMDGLEHRFETGLRDMLMKSVDIKEHGKLHQEHIIEQMNKMPMLTKGILSDLLRDMEKQNHNIDNAITMTQKNIAALQLNIKNSEVKQADAVTRAQQSSEFVVSRLDAIDKQVARQSHSTKIKGMEGESHIFDLLNNRLYKRDGYIVEVVCGQAHSCDMVVKREKHPSIRIECKAVGQGTNEKVRYKDVEKFQRDLVQVNNHGLFVSIYSGIVGVGNFEIQQLSNGKFAMYLSNNNHDIDVIIDCMHLLYKLDSITSVVEEGEEDDENHILISVESMSRIQTYLKDYAKKLSTIKTHMKESITLLSEIQIDIIEKILLGNQPKPKAQEMKSIGRNVCEYCKKEYASEKSCANHRRKCTAAPKND